MMESLRCSFKSIPLLCVCVNVTKTELENIGTKTHGQTVNFLVNYLFDEQT